MPVRVVGRYELLSELGRGANGVVWRARHTLLPDRLVALKVLSEELWSSPQARRRFLQEAIAVSRLDHPRIATLYDAEEVEGQLYIAFKLIDGETVGRKVAGGAMPIRRAVEIGRDASEALAHAHEQGVIHRDLSAGNIMVDREGRGILVDFGLARPSEQTATVSAGLIAGTLPFMPPEVLQGKPADARSDIYSLGAVLYLMLTGRTPFQGATAEEIAVRILRDRPEAPSAITPSIPSELDDVVLRALERDPGDRFATAREVASALDEILGASVVERVPWGGRWLPTLRRSLLRRSARWAVIAGAACLAAMLGFGIAWVAGWRPGFMTGVPVVAVLPTRNLSSDSTETAYLREAFGEDLVTRLGQVSKLRLLPWLTTQRFNDPKQGFQDIGRELHADKLVVGSYRSDGDRIRVTMTLVDANTGIQSWSQIFEESSDDIFSLQQSIATGIASHLRGELTNSERERLGVAASRSPDAYDWYLRGANFMNSQDPQSVAMAGPYFEKALELDPNLSEAWVGLGATKTDSYFRGQAGNADLSAAEDNFRRALSLNPKLYAAIRGLIRVTYERGHYENVLRIGSALAKSTNDPEALLTRGWAYTLGGLPEKGVVSFNRVLELDPASQAAAWYRVIAASWAGQLAQAVEWGRDYIKRYGEDPELYYWMGLALLGEGKRSDAELCLNRSLQLFGEDQSNMYSAAVVASYYRNTGRPAQADSLASTWLGITDARFRAHPDNFRARLYRNSFAATLGLLSGKSSLDSLLAAVTDQETTEDASALLEVLGAYGDATWMRTALDRIRREDMIGMDIYFKNGSLEASLGTLYASVVDSPEFMRFSALARRRHEDLAARY